jgi:hypothetical protein
MAKERKKIALGFIFSWIAAVLYMTGLAFLMPFATLLIFPPTVFILPPKLWTLTFIAVGLVIISAIILVLQKKSMGDAFVSLSIMTFTVGAIAVFLVIFNKESIMDALNFMGTLKPAAEGYIAYWEFFLPKAWISIAGYFVLAVVLWAAGNRIRRQQYQVGWMQRMFGKRIKIFK